MVVPEQVSDDDMVLMARDIAKQIEFELSIPDRLKSNVIRESQGNRLCEIAMNHNSRRKTSPCRKRGLSFIKIC